MKLNRLTSYEKLEELQGVKTSKGSKTSNIMPIDKIF